MNTDNLAFYKRMTKKAFEQRLLHEFPNVSKTPINENTYEDGRPCVKHLTLYYSHNAHIGTWMTGTGWIFKSAYTN